MWLGEPEGVETMVPRGLSVVGGWVSLKGWRLWSQGG